MTWLSCAVRTMAHPAGRGAIVAVLLVSGCSTATPSQPTKATAGVVTGGGPSVAASGSARTPTPAALALSSAKPSGASSAQPSGTSPAEMPAVCPEDQVLVDGMYCSQYQLKCLRRRKPWQCAEYEKPGKCTGPEVHKRFCIDRYEWPNKQGAIATVMNSWTSAKKQCADVGKRLCTDAEWTLACEGPDRLAFPYGYTRDSEACPIDKKSPKVNERRLFWKKTQAEEVTRLDQREPSGTRPRCVSGYGVHDLTGNVDEWVVNEAGRPYKSSLKGGNWGEYRNACRPTTRGHDEGFYYYQTGFRCCSDPPS